MTTVMTVTGPVEVSTLGRTLPHEHLLIDLSPYVDELARFTLLPHESEQVGLANLGAIRGNPYGNRDNCILDSVELAVRELELFKAAGGQTLVDATNNDIGSDPLALREISERTGVNIVAGCGHYVNFAQPDQVRQASRIQITESLLQQIQSGLKGTDVRPGIIGEIGTTHPLHPNEEKVLRAAATAQKETGLPLSVHVHPPTRAGHDVLDLLEGEGVDLQRVVLCHIDAALAHNDIEFADAVAYQQSLAERGAFVEFDLCGNSGYFSDGPNSWWLPSDRERAKAIGRLVDAGYAGSLLISQDVGHKHYLSEYGGWGFGHVLTVFKDMVADFGVDTATHEAITVANPARMLTGQEL
ncbi:phosphotriesterase [Oryzobacter terrae]|uniref:phosphotriesterase family protein n=1 Tax=Oryzobacter terrae TaxID=1620385 RepID=UPI00366CB6B9